MTVRIYEGLNANLQPTFTDEEMECIRVCVSNAPIPYDITQKQTPAEILEKIGQPQREEHQGETRIKIDLGVYQ